MTAAQERLERVHQRAARMQHARDRRGLVLSAAASVFLLVCLLASAAGISRTPRGIGEAEYTASALLFESAGGYVLVGVVAFMAAVIITVLCLRYSAKRKSTGQKERSDGADGRK